ncbi:unnamed protein product, partial [Chrysoparadoxa australica]
MNYQYSTPNPARGNAGSMKASPGYAAVQGQRLGLDGMTHTPYTAAPTPQSLAKRLATLESKLTETPIPAASPAARPMPTPAASPATEASPGMSEIRHSLLMEEKQLE